MTDYISGTVSVKMDFDVEEFRVPFDEIETEGGTVIARLNSGVIY